MQALVPRSDVRYNALTVGKIVLASVTIYSMIIPIVIMDLFIFFYQQVYFSILGIPKIDRRKYISIERWNLPQLTFAQRVHCAYCDYANGLTSYAKAVTNQTEIFSCAIKYTSRNKNAEEFRQNYYSRSDFR